MGYLVMIIGLTPGILLAQQPAFPTAEGFGAYSMGGRGGDVYHVTNLNNSGAGSLRYGIDQATGPRTIVFDVSGTIQLLSNLRVESDYITIAGHTAPGDGICVRDYTFDIRADHVIVRYIRARLGDMSGQESDAMSIVSGKNIIVDHCSASWSVDEALSCSTADRDKIDKVTVQWCFISEALNESVHVKGPHSYGALIRGCYGAQYSYLHNLFAHNRSRNPRPGNYDTNPFDLDSLGLQFDFRNNVMYNWAGSQPGYDADTKSVCRYNYVGNYGKPGPNSSSTGYAYDVGSPYFRAYYSDNYFFGSIPEDQWSLVNFSGFSTAQISAYKKEQPYSGGPVLTLSPQEAYNTVLEQGGASLHRDIVDTRVKNEVINGSGAIINSQEEVGSWPVLNSVATPLDTDQDGMPDEWETSRGLDKNVSSDRNGDDDNDGFTNLEEYLHELTGLPSIWHKLAVNMGTGSGLHIEGSEVNIAAESAPGGQVFDCWLGDTLTVTDRHAASTTVLIPAGDVELSASYKNIVSVLAEETNAFPRCYPNPAHENFSIDLGQILNADIRMFNLSGRKVYQAKATDSVHQVNTRHLSPGIYVVRVTDTASASYTQRIVIR